MKPLRVLIVDDEPLARSGLRALVRKDAELEVVGESGDGQAAVEAIEALKPDLVLLDVQMPEIDGFGVIRAIGPEQMPPVIFVTAYEKFALEAFRVHALDYLVKPFTDQQLADALERAKKGQLRRPGQELGEPKYAQRLLVRVAQRVQVVRVAEIDWIEAADYCARLHAGSSAHVVRVSLGALERLLDPEVFVRVHRSAIVNVERLKEIAYDDTGDGVVTLADGTRVKLARSRRGAVDRVLGRTL